MLEKFFPDCSCPNESAALPTIAAKTAARTKKVFRVNRISVLLIQSFQSISKVSGFTRKSRSGVSIGGLIADQRFKHPSAKSSVTELRFKGRKESCFSTTGLDHTISSPGSPFGPFNSSTNHPQLQTGNVCVSWSTRLVI